MYSLYQNCTANCGFDPKAISYMLNRSTDQGSTWSLNGSATGISVAIAQSRQPTPKFGTVNALLGGIDHAAVDPSTGDLYYVYGYLDASNNNNLAIRRVFDNGSGGVNVGPQNIVTSGNTCAIPSVAVTSHGTIGVFFYCFNGIVAGFPQFTAWLAVSTDQGVSFSSTPLVTFLSPAVDNGDPRQRVLGDYQQLKAIDNCFYGGFVANRAAFFGSLAISDPVFVKACYGQSASTHDTSGDGFSDILWRNTTTGQVLGWFLNGSTVIGGGSPGSATNDWAIVGQRDFNGDGFSDILWRNKTNGQVMVWLTQGATVIGTASLGSMTSDWVIVGTGDFNGDGFADILWYNANAGPQIVVWLTNGTSVTGVGSRFAPGSPWTVAGTGDFNGDGMTDILWYNTSSGEVLIWLMDVASVIGSGVPGSVTTDWVIVGTGDFNGDGMSDILWRNATTGQLVIWLINGSTVIGGGSPGSAASDWAVEQTGDYNGDRTSDILWRNTTTGQVLIWFINGTLTSGGGSPGSATIDWQIQVMNAD